MSDITALVQKLKDRAEQAKRIGAKNPRFTADEVLALVEAQKHETQASEMAVQLSSRLTVANKRIAELEKSATEPVAWTDEQELRDVERNGCGYLFTVNPITPHADERRVIKLYTVPPAMESRTVTVKLRDINEYLAEVHDKTLRRALRLTAEGVRAGDIAAMTAAGIQVIEGEA